jgi:CheY-like chemotaxis protein
MKPQSEFSIFLVDDDPFFLGICEKMLQNLGYKKITAFQSSRDFINNIRQNPDIILLDYNMELMDGLETLKKIKQFNPDLLVVFISGQENNEVVVNALKYGAFDYLAKNKIDEERLRILMGKGMALKEVILKNYNKTVTSRVLSTIGIPIVTWLILETFFR